MKCLLVLVAACRAGGDDGSSGGITPIALEVTPSAMLATVVVNGSAPIPVVVDTGSVGLRVFDPVTADLGDAASATVHGHLLVGHVATATVQIGDIQLPAALAFELVDSGDTGPYTDAGIHGILGLGLGAGAPAAIYNPLAQLPGITTYAIHAGGVGSTAGSLELAAVPRGYTTVDLPPAGALPDGLMAWTDDALAGCYRVSGSPVDPPCTDTAIDSTATTDTILANALPAGPLASGTAFAVAIGAFSSDFTAGVTPGQDLVTVDPSAPGATLGLELFLRFDVLYDLATGAIGFRAI